MSDQGPGTSDGSAAEWSGPSLAEVLDAPELPRGVQIGRPHVHERVLARDRAGDLGVVATVRPAGRAGRAWYWACYVLSRDGGAWHEEGFDHGDRWPRDPATPRSQTPGYDVGTAIACAGDGDGRAYAVTGGVVGGPVAGLEVVTSVERHAVPIDPVSGAFTLLALLAGGDMRFELTARAADGRVLDRWARDPSVREAGPEDVELIETHDALGTSTAAIRRVRREPG